MKIGRITSTFSPYEGGGANIFAENLTTELANRNHQNVVITINPSRGDAFEERKNLKIYRFHPFNFSTFQKIGKESILRQIMWTALDVYNPYSFKKIREILIKERPDVVHVHTPIDMTLSVFDAVKSLRIPLVFTLHDYLLLCRRIVLLHGLKRICTNENINPLCKVYRAFTKRIVDNKIDVVTAPSTFSLNKLTEEGFFKDTRAYIVPHGVDVIPEANINESQLIDDSQGINILYVGGLREHKGVQVIIKAIKQIKSKNIKLHIAGNGVYENQLKGLAGDDERISFYGRLSHNELQKFYSCADVLVVPSIWCESFGRVIIEAFRAGMPVICSNVGGMPELVMDNYNGYLFEAGNTDQLIKILEGLLDDPKRLKLLKKNVRESANKYKFSECVNKFVEIYAEAIALNRSRG